MNIPFKITRTPALEEELCSLISVTGVKLPSAYLDFLRQSNGAECGPNDEPGDSLRLLQADEVKRFNDDYKIQVSMPDLLAFASDGGDHAFCFQISSSVSPNQWPIIRLPLGAMFRDEELFVAESFMAWHLSGFRYPIY